jgi:WD40 repeat protein
MSAFRLLTLAALLAAASALAACNLVAPDLPTPVAPLPTNTVLPSAPTVTASPAPATQTPVQTESPTAPPGPTTEARQQFIAYVQNGQLLVTDVTGGVKGGTTQYTLEGVDDQVSDIVWSPSGEFIAYTSFAQGQPRVFVVYAVGAGTPVEIGPGANPAWSPDNTQLVFERNFNLWITPVESPEPRQLTFETDWAWGRTVFTPDGKSILTASVSRMNMGASGNTQFRLETVDPASGARTTLPGMQALPQGLDGRLPYDLRFSRDGRRLAFSTSFHISACAAAGAYYVTDAKGNSPFTLTSPALSALLESQKEIYYLPFGYAWSPAGDALAASSVVVDCTAFAGTRLGAQISILGLDGSEGLVIPGEFWSLSYDRSGQYLAAARTNVDDPVRAAVQLFSTQTGGLVLDLGEGAFPQFQP